MMWNSSLRGMPSKLEQATTTANVHDNFPSSHLSISMNQPTSTPQIPLTPPNTDPNVVTSSFMTSFSNEMRQFDFSWHPRFVDYVRLQQVSDFEKSLVKLFLNNSTPSYSSSNSNTEGNSSNTKYVQDFIHHDTISEFLKTSEQFEGVFMREKAKLSNHFDLISASCQQQLLDLQLHIQSNPYLTARPQVLTYQQQTDDSQPPQHTRGFHKKLKTESNESSSLKQEKNVSNLSPLCIAFYASLDYFEVNDKSTLAFALANTFLSLVQFVDLLKRYVVLNVCALWRFLQIHTNCLKPLSHLPSTKDENEHANIILQHWKKESEMVCTGVDTLLRAVYELMTQFSALDPQKQTLLESTENLHFNWSTNEYCLLCQQQLHLSVQLRCNHQFCFNCLVQLPTFGVSCPMCNTPHDDVQLDIDKVLRCLLRGKFHDLDKNKMHRHRFSMETIKTDVTNSIEDSHGPLSEPPTLVWSSNSTSSPEGDSPLSSSECSLTSPFSASTSPNLNQWHAASCHQCKSAKDSSLLFFCSTGSEKGTDKQRCRKKYCDNCLRRSYNNDVWNPSATNWLCPSCQGLCICASCNRQGSSNYGITNMNINASGNKMDSNSGFPQGFGMNPSISANSTPSAKTASYPYPGKLLHIPSDASAGLFPTLDSPFNRQVSFLSQLTNPWANPQNLYLDRLPSTGSLNFLFSYNYEGDNNVLEPQSNPHKRSFARMNSENRIDELTLSTEV